MNWYALHTYSGFEKKVKRDIEHRASIEGLREELGQVLIPEEKVVEMKPSGRKETARNLMPGYVFVEMAANEELFKTIRDINGVANFVGAGDQPSPLSPDEIANIRGLVEDKKEKPRPEIKFRVGDQVKVTEGPFSNFIGTVEHIDVEKARLKVMVSIFGRPTPVDLSVLEVEKSS